MVKREDINKRSVPPLVSFVTPMKEKDFRVMKLIKSIRAQNYPQDKVEIIITDGGSNPKVIEACKKEGAKIFHNLKGFAEGAGMGKDQGIWHSNGEYIVIAESDIELIGREWINNMLRPFTDNPEVFGVMPKLFVNPQDNKTNKYLSYVGVDPFAAYRSIEGQLEFDKKLSKVKRKPYTVLKLDKTKPYCMGSNGFMFKKEYIKKVGDYAQDVEFIARLAKNGYTKFAVAQNAKVWHKNVKGLKDFIRKRIKWTRDYTTYYSTQKKDFNWISNKRQFIFYVAKNITFIYNIPISIKKYSEYKDSAWILHAPLMFFSTGLNIYYSLKSKSMMKQVL